MSNSITDRGDAGGKIADRGGMSALRGSALAGNGITVNNPVCFSGDAQDLLLCSAPRDSCRLWREGLGARHPFLHGGQTGT